MFRSISLLGLLFGVLANGFSQENMFFSNPQIDVILQSTVDPDLYPPTASYESPEQLVALLADEISSDSLKAYLFGLNAFETRNTGSDTLSETRGMGAARKWVLQKFDQFDERVEGRLETGYFEFDQEVCGMMHHKNVVACLPGALPPADAGVIIIEGHLDSRCSDVCDIDCVAQGMEDNASGSALVIELARVMSPYRFNSTILFVATTGEEQGLVGANALAQYIQDNEINLKMVQNNDIVGGVICGETSSAPSCPGLNHIDSTQVRLFSNGSSESPHKSLARYIKLQYSEMLEPISSVPMQLTLMSAEDRSGRGGDHIPFRERDYPAMRFTSANEHGNASQGPDYHDRQHTVEDLLGVDTDMDGVIDSFFVNFNYLARNARINATSASMAAIAPDAPELAAYFFDGETFYIEVVDDPRYEDYVVGVRTDFNDFDTLHYLNGVNGGNFETPQRELFIFLSVAAIDSNGVESLFSEEVITMLSSSEEIPELEKPDFQLMSNRPNPFDEATTLSFWCEDAIGYNKAQLVISDVSGRVLTRLETDVRQGVNEVLYHHGYGATGVLTQTLLIDGEFIESRSMIFAN